MAIQNVTRNTVIATEVRIANTFLTRLVGLLDRENISPHEALIIRGCNSIHMFFMKFPIDVIFVDRGNHIVGLIENIKPFMLSPTFFKSSYAIEVAVGTILKSKSEKGDMVKLI